MIHSSLLRTSSLCLCVSVVILLSSGCQTARMREPVRAIWVPRFDYKTPADVTRIMENCAGAGFNTVIFQVRGNGTAFYCSSVEPWADELGGRDPGWDPLALACREAHERHMELHAWVNVMPAWNGRQPPANPEQLYNKHPEWFWYDADGQRQPLVHRSGDSERAWYVSLNPCLPEARAYLVEVFRDLVARYDVDGLHMDYIRFPNEPVVRGEKIPDYPRDPATLALYKQATGLAPDDNAEKWTAWRTAQVTQLVRQIHETLRRTKPRVVFSASLSPAPQNAVKAHFQDGRTWRNDGLIDAAIIMNYTEGAEVFEQRLEPWLVDQPRDWLTRRPRTPLVPGLWFGSAGRTPQETATAVQRQIEVARVKTGNFCVFAYSSLFDSADEVELTRQSDAQRQMRQARREALLPYLRTVAAAK